MNIRSFLSLTITFFYVIGCSPVKKMIKQGEVVPEDFYTKVSFDTIKSVLLLPCELEGETRNYLFDTGAQITGVMRDSISGERVSVRGASNRAVESGTETIESFKIGEVNFVKTFATNDKFAGLKDSIPNFGGILGYSIIGKANWLINYPEGTVEISDRNLSDASFQDIELYKTKKAPYTDIIIDGASYKSIIDLGSISALNVPEGTVLAEYLLATYKFKPKNRDRYTIGGWQSITEQIAYLPSMKIGDIEFKNVRVNINQSSQIRVGMRLFKEFIIYIDNDERKYQIRRPEGTVK